MPLPQIGTDADDGHVVAAIEADGLGVEIEWGCHTKSDAVDVADGDFLHGTIGLMNLSLLALYVQTYKTSLVLLKESLASLIIFRHVSDNTYLCTSSKELQYDEKVFNNSNRNGYAVRLTDGTGRNTTG